MSLRPITKTRLINAAEDSCYADEPRQSEEGQGLEVVRGLAVQGYAAEDPSVDHTEQHDDHVKDVPDVKENLESLRLDPKDKFNNECAKEHGLHRKPEILVNCGLLIRPVIVGLEANEHSIDNDDATEKNVCATRSDPMVLACTAVHLTQGAADPSPPVVVLADGLEVLLHLPQGAGTGVIDRAGVHGEAADGRDHVAPGEGAAHQALAGLCAIEDPKPDVVVQVIAA